MASDSSSTPTLRQGIPSEIGSSLTFGQILKAPSASYRILRNGLGPALKDADAAPL
ncbi:GM20950 [Drosophila sechellia]|uniref:GM20950 n=1 Tax=Drosophila sechellia TaxID=7238 RepID=B4HQU0_DROSE|nr:GM20950 [Drosophila sechellia]